MLRVKKMDTQQIFQKVHKFPIVIVFKSDCNNAIGKQYPFQSASIVVRKRMTFNGVNQTYTRKEKENIHSNKPKLYKITLYKCKNRYTAKNQLLFMKHINQQSSYSHNFCPVFADQTKHLFIHHFTHSHAFSNIIQIN